MMFVSVLKSLARKGVPVQVRPQAPFSALYLVNSKPKNLIYRMFNFLWLKYSKSILRNYVSVRVRAQAPNILPAIHLQTISAQVYKIKVD